MTELEQERREHIAERPNEVDFEGYRQVVDELNSAFRKTGIIDAGGYDRAMRDPRTVRLRASGDQGSIEMPFIVPLEYIAGYDTERTKRLTTEDSASMMALPLSALTAPDAEIVLPESERVDFGSSAIIVETDHAETEDAMNILPQTLQSVGSFVPRQFLDIRIKNPEQQPAAMTVYQTGFEAVDEAGQKISSQNMNFFEAYEEIVSTGQASHHTVLLDVHALRQNEALVEDLWELCKDRFEWLGDYHPVSMEDTKDFFMQIVLNEDTHSIIRYDKEGKPACLGFFISGLEECTWLKPSFCEAINTEAAERLEQVVYFYGIAGKSETAAHYGQDVMQLLARIAQQMGGRYRLLFESTNMSSRYIPRMVGQYVGQGAGLEMTEPITKVAQMDYWYLSPPKID